MTDSVRIIKVLVEPEVRTVKVLVPGIQGPPGNDGADSGASIEIVQDTPLATWTFSLPPEITRRPSVEVYDESGSLMLADVVATTNQVTITFASPTAGSIVLS